MMKVIFLLSLYFSTVTVFSQPLNISRSDGEVFQLLREKILVHSDKDFYISGQTLWFSVYVTNLETNRLQSLSKTAYAELVSPDGRPFLQTGIELKGGIGSGSFLLPVTTPSGTFQLRIYTSWMKNHPSSIFSKPVTIVNTQHTFDTSAFRIEDDSDVVIKGGSEQSGNKEGLNELKNSTGSVFPLTIHTDKTLYKPRSPVNISILPDGVADDSIANVSIAVFRLNVLTRPKNWFSQLENNLTAENPNKIENQYGESFLPEMDGLVVTVLARDSADQEPVKGVPVIISLTGKLTDVKYSETDDKGLAYFNLKNVYGTYQLLVKTEPEYQNKVVLQVLKPFALFSNVVSEKGNLRNSYLEAIEEMHNHLVVTRAFDSTNSREIFFPENADSLSFYGKPYAVYLLDDYKRFVTMEEVLREYVKEVSVRIKKKDYFIYVLNRQMVDLRNFLEVNVMMEKEQPLILIDGVPVSPNTLMKYDPLQVRKLEIIADQYIIGKKIFDGILSFTTYKGQFDGLKLNSDELLSDGFGWERKRKFETPDYNDPLVKNARIPDFRELLYWEPQMKISKSLPGKLSFFTGDLTGKFVAVIQGVSGNGRRVDKVIEFVVEN